MKSSFNEQKYNYTNYTHIHTDRSFRRIALWVAMETLHLNIARISSLVGTIFEGMHGVQMNNSPDMETCPRVAR